MPSAKLRKARIMLLKITHIPIVGAIWLFESAQEQMGGGVNRFSSIGPSMEDTNQYEPTKKQRPFLSNRTDTKTSSQHFPEDGLQIPGPCAVKGKREIKGEAVMVDNAGLEARVADLTTKIAELTALMMALQGTSTEES